MIKVYSVSISQVVEGDNYCVQIINNSIGELHVDFIPEKPKRKCENICIIPKKSFINIDENIDIKRLSFRWG